MTTQKKEYVAPIAELTILTPKEAINVSDEQDLAMAMSQEQAAGGFSFEVVDPDFPGFD